MYSTGEHREFSADTRPMLLIFSQLIDFPGAEFDSFCQWSKELDCIGRKVGLLGGYIYPGFAERFKYEADISTVFFQCESNDTNCAGSRHDNGGCNQRQRSEQAKMQARYVTDNHYTLS